MVDRLQQLSDAGVSIWLDDLSRERILTGNLQQLIDDFHVVGVTSNPSIFEKALSNGEVYAPQIAQLREQGEGVESVVRTLTTDDVRSACDLLAPIFEATNGVDGRASIEVDPRLAHETDPTVAEARELWTIVDRPNAYIKIPATLEGVPAITAAIAAGINVNVTLIFSVERYAAVLDAYLTGLEQARDAGLDLSNIYSVASVFVSRCDTEVDKRLEAIGTDEALALRGKAALAVAWLCNEVYEEVSASERWQNLAAAGATPQRPLWASTGTKNKAYSDVLYVEELVTAGTVNTMPEGTLKAFADHGEVRGDTVIANYAAGHAALEGVAAVGVDMDDVFATLESEGVAKFIEAWGTLLAAMEEALQA